MLNKIDHKIIDKIFTQSNECYDLDVIVTSNEYVKTKEYLQKKSHKFLELPFISSFALKASIKEIYGIANQNFVHFISAVAKVNSLIYDSKKFMGVDDLYSKVNNNIKQSCVIIDTGLYPHIDFCLGKNRIIKFIDLINNKTDPYDDNGHGTFVTGVLTGNGIVDKYTGIDNNADIIVIKALDNDGETTSIKILQAMQWILENKQKFNIKVVCMSFGSVFNDARDPLMKGAEVLWDNGISVICAGGNNGPEEKTIMSPGSSKKVITVGSLDNIRSGIISVADFSSRGPVFNYYKPDLVVPGVDIISTARFNNSKKFYTTMSGTSVSTPMVAGVVSLLYKINPRYTPDQIKYILLRSCIQITGDKNSEGFGWLNLRNIIL